MTSFAEVQFVRRHIFKALGIAGIAMGAAVTGS